ncbi:hypothetical protein BN7_6195 [Wickerhamomyces ciferrii]|uniref:Uncharacterized protein n=1 Tax=Wickerhamomyces ciferrii (strain ATCC 14091 / BCRC 22168 / CBS 111 / JCM 3599 / NBRC 0793 / NRRL Y-1031 F-60-10) TaxID=1206466 RepID=K0KTU1_WICCF|nr:uncharacterized protein BN7_6195 [Wickerhamomyces ciferrii]CCH46601.1 hypothetical protein BN7_6195 [Wickerhamomyces ciferrii]
MIQLNQLNTRDILLLAQLSEQHGIDNYKQVHEELYDHPVWKLSHNRLNKNELLLNPNDTQSLIDQLIEKHEDLPIVEICEYYYDVRLKELESEIQENKELFHLVKSEV